MFSVGPMENPISGRKLSFRVVQHWRLFDIFGNKFISEHNVVLTVLMIVKSYVKKFEKHIKHVSIVFYVFIIWTVSTVKDFERRFSLQCMFTVSYNYISRGRKRTRIHGCCLPGVVGFHITKPSYASYLTTADGVREILVSREKTTFQIRLRNVQTSSMTNKHFKRGVFRIRKNRLSPFWCAECRRRVRRKARCVSSFVLEKKLWTS